MKSSSAVYSFCLGLASAVYYTRAVLPERKKQHDIFFENDLLLNNVVKKVRGVRWSQRSKSQTIPGNSKFRI
jgi:hypothetical protein